MGHGVALREVTCALQQFQSRSELAVDTCGQSYFNVRVTSTKSFGQLGAHVKRVTLDKTIFVNSHRTTTSGYYFSSAAAMMEPDTDLSFSACSSLDGGSAVETPTKQTKLEPPDIDIDAKEMRQMFVKRWQRLGKGWQKKFLIGNCLPKGVKPQTAAAQQLANQPWVFGAKSGCGCLPCSKANTGSEWGLATAGLVPKFRACFLQKHQESKSHIDAVKMMLGIGDYAPGAPPLEEFESLLKKLQSGSSMRSASKPIKSDFG